MSLCCAWMKAWRYYVITLCAGQPNSVGFLNRKGKEQRRLVLQPMGKHPPCIRAPHLLSILGFPLWSTMPSQSNFKDLMWPNVRWLKQNKQFQVAARYTSCRAVAKTSTSSRSMDKLAGRNDNILISKHPSAMRRHSWICRSSVWNLNFR